jgi:hypothetical protein
MILKLSEVYLLRSQCTSRQLSFNVSKIDEINEYVKSGWTRFCTKFYCV